MSKLSPSLKSLINAPFARPGQAPAPHHIRDVYARIAKEAREKNYGERPWITISAAATFTLNSPASLAVLHNVATDPSLSSESPLSAAELIREIGLKCISFNGIPRTINSLGEFRAHVLSAHPKLATQFETRASRAPTAQNIESINARGRALWTSIYVPFDAKLESKLAESHPDLPVHILGSHYGPLLSDPEGERGGLASVGRNLTSIVAISCLRAQTGVGPQVLSHVFGLRKGVEQGTHKEEFREAEAEAEGVERLATDEGCEWILKSVDSISEAIGANFAQHGRESKL